MSSYHYRSWEHEATFQTNVPSIQWNLLDKD